jgi:hypothetical protein
MKRQFRNGVFQEMASHFPGEESSSFMDVNYRQNMAKNGKWFIIFIIHFSPMIEKILI